jgi:hypothetical protein
VVAVVEEVAAVAAVVHLELAEGGTELLLVAVPAPVAASVAVVASASAAILSRVPAASVEE